MKKSILLLLPFFLASCGAALPSAGVPGVPENANGGVPGSVPTVSERMKIDQGIETLRGTPFESCDSAEFLARSKESLVLLKFDLNSPGNSASAISERCKIRAIVKGKKDCSLLTAQDSQKRCAYAKQAYEEIQDLSQKTAVYRRLFGPESASAELPADFSGWK